VEQAMNVPSRSLPAALNPLDDWVLYGLSLPDPVDRRLALELASDFTDETILESVRLISRSDPDPYCRTAARAVIQRQVLLQRARDTIKEEIDLSPASLAPLCEREDPLLRPALLQVI